MARLAHIELDEKKNWTWNQANLYSQIRSYWAEKRAEVEVQTSKPTKSDYLSRIAKQMAASDE